LCFLFFVLVLIMFTIVGLTMINPTSIIDRSSSIRK
jgi:hypothetical protein